MKSKTLFVLVFISMVFIPVLSFSAGNKDSLDSELMMAIIAEDLNKCRELIEKGADVIPTKTMKMPPLSMAANINKTKSMEFLIEKGANVNAKNPIGMTALMYAASSGHIEAVTLLLEKGADINAVDDFGKTAFLYAASGGKADVVKLLAAKGAGTSTKTDSHTALMEKFDKDHTLDRATRDRFANEIKDVKARSNHMGNALIDASKKGDTETVKLLLQKGADINGKNDTGQTALIVSGKA